MFQEFINNKAHAVYISIIICILIIGYSMILKKPKEVIKEVVKTQVQTKEVVKYVDKINDKVIHRVIETTNKDGTVTKIVEDVTDKSKTQASTGIKESNTSTVSEKEVQKFLSRYTIDVMYPLPIDNILHPSFEPRDIQVLYGMRLGDLPVFLKLGTTGRLNSIILGVGIEF